MIDTIAYIFRCKIINVNTLKRKLTTLLSGLIFFNGWFVFKNNGDMQSIRVSLNGKNKKYFNNFAFD